MVPLFSFRSWNDWVSTQVHRIHDLMDINVLRLAKVFMDCTYKTMVWNLSQNVDRDTMGKVRFLILIYDESFWKESFS